MEIREIKNDYFSSILMDVRDTDKVGQDEINNFILNTTIPLLLTGRIGVAISQRADWATDFTFTPKEGIFKQIQASIAGSVAEGLPLPVILCKSGKGYIMEASDQDIKLVLLDLPVREYENGAFAVPEPAPNAPIGFIQLRYNRNFRVRYKTTNTERRQHSSMWNPSAFLTSDGLVDCSKLRTCLGPHLQSFLKNEFKRDTSYVPFLGQQKLLFSRHGPAYTVDMVDKSLGHIYSHDYVLALPFPSWPVVAQEWVTRTRLWPDRKLVTAVMKKGCHIVLKQSKAGRSHRTEFIFSFSFCDKSLSQAMNLNQKRCYMLMKYVFKYRLNRVKRGLTTYHCKTVFLRLCEKRPGSQWTEHNPMECLVLLLEKLKEYLLIRNLPHYYISEYNLLEGISEASTVQYVRDIERVLESPGQCVLQLSEWFRFQWMSLDVSLLDFLQPLIMETNITRRLLKSLTLEFLSNLIDKEDVMFVIATICQHTTDIMYGGPETLKVIETFQTLIGRYQTDRYIVNFKALYASLCHQMVSINQILKKPTARFLQLARSTFLDIINKVDIHIWIYGAYYDLLFRMDDHANVIRHFLSHVCPKQVLSYSGVFFSTTPYNYLTTNPIFSPYDLNDTTIEKPSLYVFCDVKLPAPACILFRVIFAYMALYDKSRSPFQKIHLQAEARKVLVYFDHWVRRKCLLYPSFSDDFLFLLLGLASNEVGNTAIRSSSVKDTTKYGSTLFKDISYEEFKDVSRETACSMITNLSRHRHHPFKHQIKYKMYRLPQSLKFVGGKVRVGQFLE